MQIPLGEVLHLPVIAPKTAFWRCVSWVLVGFSALRGSYDEKQMFMREKMH